MARKSCRDRSLIALRLRGEVGSRSGRGERVLRSLHLQNLRMQPLTPTLSPQERGEAAH
jgi:hypothetical protein